MKRYSKMNLLVIRKEKLYIRKMYLENLGFRKALQIFTAAFCGEYLYRNQEFGTPKGISRDPIENLAPLSLKDTETVQNLKQSN